MRVLDKKWREDVRVTVALLPAVRGCHISAMRYLITRHAQTPRDIAAGSCEIVRDVANIPRDITTRFRYIAQSSKELVNQPRIHAINFRDHMI